MKGDWNVLKEVLLGQLIVLPHVMEHRLLVAQMIVPFNVVMNLAMIRSYLDVFRIHKPHVVSLGVLHVLRYALFNPLQLV